MQTITEREREMLLAFAENDMSPTKTAEQLYYSRGTVSYHLGRIKEKTGYDPKDFYGLVRLLRLIKRL